LFVNWFLIERLPFSVNIDHALLIIGYNFYKRFYKRSWEKML